MTYVVTLKRNTGVTTKHDLTFLMEDGAVWRSLVKSRELRTLMTGTRGLKRDESWLSDAVTYLDDGDAGLEA